MKNTLFCIIIILFNGCTEGWYNDIGPCEHVYIEPVLHIESAGDSVTGQEIDNIKISNVFLDSEPAHFIILKSQMQNIEVVDSVLHCTIPCAFGIEPGDYEFTVSSEGYEDVALKVFAIYSEGGGGCPSYSNGGTRIKILMVQE